MASNAVDLIREKGAALPSTARERFADEQLAVFWDMHAKGCSLAEFSVLLGLAEKYDLDLNAHEIWAAKSKDRDGGPGKLMILVGRDGLLTIARRQADFLTVDGDVHRKNDHFKVVRREDGTRTVEHSYTGSVEDRGDIVGSWAMVQRRDGAFTNFTYCPWAEYVPSGTYSSPWKKQASAMMQKCSVSLALRIAYGISGVVGEDEVAAQFGADPVAEELSLDAVAQEVPHDLRDRLLQAYLDARNLRGGQVTVAAIQMSVSRQPRERIVEFIEQMEAANDEARGEQVVDAEVVPDAASPSTVRTGEIESLERQLADLRTQLREVEESPGDPEETEAELDRLQGEIDQVEGLLSVAVDEQQGRLL